MKLKLGSAMARPARSSFAFKEPLLAISIAVPMLLGCKGENKPAEPANPPAQSVFVPEPEIPHFIPSGPAYKTVPSQIAVPEAASPAVLPDATPSSPTPSLSSEVYSALSGIIARRVAQESPKMKLSSEQGRLAETYLRADLPAMQSMRALASRMPKTTIELVRAVHERSVLRDEAEGMAAYLLRMLDSMHISRLDTFDECCSHVLGRQWSQIDYSGEKQDWQSQQRHYSSRDVPDLLTAENVRKYFGIESKMPYFRRIFNPQGLLPE